MEPQNLLFVPQYIISISVVADKGALKETALAKGAFANFSVGNEGYQA